MAFSTDQLLYAAVGLAAIYLIFRLVLKATKNQRNYQQQLEKVITSDEYKVKGRFE